jgi:integrase
MRERHTGTIFRRGGKGPWWISWYEGWTQVRESAGNDRAEAERRLQAKCMALRGLAEPQVELPFRELIEWARRKWGAGRLRHTTAALRTVEGFFGPFPARSITVDMVVLFKFQRATAESLRRELRVLRSLLAEGWARGAMETRMPEDLWAVGPPPVPAAKPAEALPPKSIGTVAALLRDYLADRDRHAKAPGSIRDTLKPLLRLLGRLRLGKVNYVRLERYRADRRQERTQLGGPPSESTLNRELTYLRAAMRRGVRLGVVKIVPPFPMAPESQAREDFASSSQAAAIVAFLRPGDPGLADLVEFLALTGWRRREAQELPWSEVRWDRGCIVLPPARTKTARERVMPIAGVGAVQELLERRKAQAVEGCPWVFHREGKPIKHFRRSWKTATKAAGCPGLRVHGLRRSLARNHRLAGIPEPVTMAIAGWRDLRSLRRYAVVDESEMSAALLKAGALAASAPVGEPAPPK